VSAAAFREIPRPQDAAAVREMVAATGFFSDEEADIAKELVDERLAKGEDSGYFFVFADSADGGLDGYACYGPTPGTVGVFDLYWICVHPAGQGKGLGKELLGEAERRIREAGGRKAIVETSSRDLYRPTRAFYEKRGYLAEARIADFYDLGDHKIIYAKTLAG